jgi:hypothetical protein
MTFLLIVTISSILLAALMGAIAWRIAAQERRRSEARIAALAAEIRVPAAGPPRAAAAQASGGRHPEIGLRGEPRRLATFPVQARPAAAWEDDLQIRSRVDHRSPAPDLFTQPVSHSRSGAVIVVGGLVILGLLTLSVVLSRGTWAGGRAGNASGATRLAQNRQSMVTPSTGTPATPRETMPLELVALGHDRDGDRLTVRGVIRNPSSAAPVDPLTAVVFAFDPDGGFIASGRAIIDSSALRPGAESTFIVTVPGAAAVGRFRVSFRSGDRIVPHVDRREPAKVSS